MPVSVPQDHADLILQTIAAKAKAKSDKSRKQIADPDLGASVDEANERLEEIRGDLGAYGEYAHGLVPARHHRAWIELIHQLIEGKLPGGKRKLMILAPPNTAKSTWLSLILPPWYLGNHPDQSLLFLTSSDTMAQQFGTTIRLSLQHNEKHKIAFPNLANRPAFKRGWSGDGLYLNGIPTSVKDPSYRAVGYGASVVGSRANGIILDDPLDQVRATSENETRKAREYLTMTLERRLQPDGWMLMITTRWSEFDLPAYILDRSDWHTVTFPMVALAGEDELGRAPGELLWPERFPQAAIDELLAEGNITQAEFNCVYQCDVSGLGGEVFKDPRWFKPLPDDFEERTEDGKSLRDKLTVVQAWDLAFSERDAAAYTACVTLGIDQRYNIYVLNVFRDKLSPYDTEDAIVRLYRTWRPRVVAIEEAAFRAQVTKQLVLQLMRKGVPNIKIVRPTTDKVARARLPAARAEAGMMYADTKQSWWMEFLSECLGFPLTKYKDQVDALSLAAHMIFEQPFEAPKKVVINPNGRPRRRMLRMVS